MEKFKQKMICGFVEYGKRHRKMIAPVIAALTVCLIFYYALRGFWQKLCQSKFRRQLACLTLVGIILLTQTDILTVFASIREDGTADYTIVEFDELPDDVKNQTVSVGTTFEELSFPTELSVCIDEEESVEETEEGSIEESTEDLEEGSTEEKTEEIEEGSTEEGTKETEEGGIEEGTKETEEGGTEEGTKEIEEGSTEETEEGGIEEDTEETEEGSTEESGETQEEIGSLEESAAAEVTVERVVVEQPEYYDEPKEQTVSVIYPDGDLDEETKRTEIISVTWESAPAYDGDVAGEYIFTPVLPDNYLPAEGVSVPEIKVTVTEKLIQESNIGIELLEPDWDNPLAEAYNISAVLAVPGEWDSYDWQVFAGPYAEDEGRPWLSVTELGMDELIFGGKLFLDKETLVTYAFRCVVESEGKFFATMPYAENEEALTAPLYQIMALSDFQSGANVWKQSAAIAVVKPGNSSHCFDIYGVDGGSFYKTTYSNGGYYIASMVGDTQVMWKAEPKTDISLGGSLVGQFDYDIVYNGHYARITYTVKNTGSTVQSFKVGSSADVMIDKNDKAPVAGTSMGLKMEDGAGKTFHLVVPDADTTWYGFWNNAYSNIFNDLSDKNTPYNGDSGMAWSWNGSVAPGGTWTRSVLIGIGEMPPAPAAPSDITITVDGSRSFVMPDETITVSGTATAGTTVHIMTGGTEYEALAGSDGRFSKQITVPSDAKNEMDIICWAVSDEGGISDTVVKKLAVMDGPQIALTDSWTSVMEGDVLDEAWYKGFIKTSTGTVSHTNISANIPGTYSVTYTASVPGFADATDSLAVTVLAHPLEIAAPAAERNGTTSKYHLNAALSYTGADAITETGFVWGIMQNPTTSVCNGRKATSNAVTTKGSSISVTTDDIVDGVTYYCRAYVVSGGVTYYSSQTSFGIDAKNYGTFSVRNNGNHTFTITRTDGTDGEQTVYYRTQNGSAVAGTHYTARAESVTFQDGETDKTIAVSEQGVNVQYSGGSFATRCSNADREYFFEIYRVDGGGMLDANKGNLRVKRTMPLASQYKVDRLVYRDMQWVETLLRGVGVNDTLTSKNNPDNIVWHDSVQTANLSVDSLMPNANYGTYSKDYISATFTSYGFRLRPWMKENDDAFEYFKFTGSTGKESLIKLDASDGSGHWFNLPRTGA